MQKAMIHWIRSTTKKDLHILSYDLVIFLLEIHTIFFLLLFRIPVLIAVNNLQVFTYMYKSKEWIQNVLYIILASSIT